MIEITADTWIESLEKNENAVVVDVRTPEECSQGILENAVMQNIFEEQAFLEFLETADKSRSYFMYCRSGMRSARACLVMDQMGFASTFNLVGGILNWKGETQLP